MFILNNINYKMTGALRASVMNHIKNGSSIQSQLLLIDENDNMKWVSISREDHQQIIKSVMDAYPEDFV